MRFLVVSILYRSDHLRGVTDKVVSDNGELWTAEKLGIAVYNTEDGASCLFHLIYLFVDCMHMHLGSDLRALSTSLTRSISDQIFTSGFIGRRQPSPLKLSLIQSILVLVASMESVLSLIVTLIVMVSVLLSLATGAKVMLSSIPSKV